MLLSGKRFVVTGIASKFSIAWAIAEALHREGAELILTYANDKTKKRVDAAAQAFGAVAVIGCDVASDASIEACRETVLSHWGDGINGVIHAIGYAPVEALQGDFATVTDRTASQIAHDVSSYSLIALAQAFREALALTQGSILTLTYHGSTQVLPNYNIMGMAKASLEAGVRYLANSLGAEGIRVNAISAGPIKTLAASGVGSFAQMLAWNEQVAPLQRNVRAEEVANAAVFLLSPWASAITAEILYVDAGFHTVAVNEALMHTLPKQ